MGPMDGPEDGIFGRSVSLAEHMDLLALADFNLVARHGGFGRAARATGRPKATLSRRVAELEGIGRNRIRAVVDELVRDGVLEAGEKGITIVP